MKIKWLLLLALFGCEAGPTAEEEAPKPKQVHTRCKFKVKKDCTESVEKECPNGYTVLEQAEETDTIIPTYKLIAECK